MNVFLNNTWIFCFPYSAIMMVYVSTDMKCDIFTKCDGVKEMYSSSVQFKIKLANSISIGLSSSVICCTSYILYEGNQSNFYNVPWCVDFGICIWKLQLQSDVLEHVFHSFSWCFWSSHSYLLKVLPISSDWWTCCQTLFSCGRSLLDLCVTCWTVIADLCSADNKTQWVFSCGVSMTRQAHI
jgi:hypothetical protein